jgi:hypothetical protein
MLGNDPTVALVVATLRQLVDREIAGELGEWADVFTETAEHLHATGDDRAEASFRRAAQLLTGRRAALLSRVDR